jgi:membrane protein YdbS with pleckstrin-like domain
MEKLHYNLSEEESSKGWKILLGLFAGIFILTGAYILADNYIFKKASIPVSFAVVPLVIGVLVGAIAIYIAVRKKDQYFNITNDELEFRYGIMRARYHKCRWDDINEIMMPRRQKKVKLFLKSGSDLVINLNWLDRQKAARIRKYLLYIAHERNINLHKVVSLRKGI